MLSKHTNLILYNNKLLMVDIKCVIKLHVRIADAKAQKRVRGGKDGEE